MLQRILNRIRVYHHQKSDVDNTNYRQQSVVDEFYRNPTVSPVTGNDAIHYQDPIYLLFNQERLQKQLGYDSAKQFLDSLNQATKDSLSELRKNCSDNDLLSTIKSRRLQTPSEITNWAIYCQNNMDKFQSQVSAAKSALEQSEQQSINNEGAQ